MTPEEKSKKQKASKKLPPDFEFQQLSIVLRQR